MYIYISIYLATYIYTYKYIYQYIYIYAHRAPTRVNPGLTRRVIPNMDRLYFAKVARLLRENGERGERERECVYTYQFIYLRVKG